MRPTTAFILTAALSVAVVTLPTAALAQAAATAASGAIPYLAIAGIVWFALDKIIDLLPIRENTLIAAIRAALNAAFAREPQ